MADEKKKPAAKSIKYKRPRGRVKKKETHETPKDTLTHGDNKKPVKDTLSKRAKRSGKLVLKTEYSTYHKSVEGKGGKQFISLNYSFFEPGRKTSDSCGCGPYDTRSEVVAAIQRVIKHYTERYNFTPGPKTIILNDETDLKFNANEFLI